MSARAPAELVHEWFERVWNQADESAIDDLLSPTGILHGLPGGEIKGPAGFKPFARSFRSAFPDINIAIRRCVTQGDFCAAHCEVTGTHTGDGLGVKPTQRRVSIEGMAIVRAADDQIQEAWNSFDFLSLYQQLELVPRTIGGR